MLSFAVFCIFMHPMLEKILPTPSEYPRENVPLLRKNLFHHLLDGSFYGLGMGFMAVPTIFPIFISELGGGSLAVGMVYVVWTLGLNIPSAFIAQRLKRKEFFKSQMVSWGLVHRSMLLLFSVMTGLGVSTVPNTVIVPLFLMLLFLTAVFGNMSGLPWFQVYTKTVPVRLRGRMMGLRQLVGSTAGVVGGYAVGIIIQTIPFPLDFSLLFFLGFTFTMVSFYFLTKIEEPPTIYPQNDEQPLRNIFAEMKRIFYADKNYRNYLLSDALILMSLSASSFYSIFALEKFSLPPSYAGTFTVIVMVSNIVANMTFGLIADHFGHKVNIITVAVCSALAALVAIFSTNIFLYGFVFLFLAAAMQTHVISRMPFIAEMSAENERPLYVGITSTITAPTVLVGIVFGGLIPYTGYQSIFLCAMLLATAAATVLVYRVHDPRTVKGKE